MNHDFHSDLQHCGDLLGQNDLEGNNLSNQLDLIKKLFEYIHYSSSDLCRLEEMTDELIKEIGSDNSLNTKLQMIQHTVKELENKRKNLEEIELDISQRTLNRIMGNNLEAFLIISRLTRDH